MTEKTRPIALAVFFPPIFVVVYLLHWTLLRLPYYWDEAGYYIPAAWDFLRLGTLIPETTARNAHPPLPSVLLAAWWKVAGFSPYSTRLLMCLVASAALLAVFRIGRTLLGDAGAAAVLILTAIYPVWFAQSTLAHADMFAAAFTLWGLSFYLDRPSWKGPAGADASSAISTGALFALACLAKETAIVTPAALFLYEACVAVRGRAGTKDKARWQWLMALAFPALPLAGWFLYHRMQTGFAFGNPEFLRYNASANLSASRVLLSLWHRLIHLLVHMNLFVPVLLSIGLLMLPSRPGKESRLTPAARVALLAVIGGHWIAFSVLGGALLTRYLLPAYPLVLLLCVAVWQQRFRWWPALAAVTLLGFAVACEVNPPYPFAPEDNLAYRDMIVLHQDAIRVLQQRYPGAVVLTAWPVAADLQRPELGYLRGPIRTVEIQNFTGAEVAKAAALTGQYDTAIVFSTKYDPPRGSLNLAGSRSTDIRFYDFHRDLQPAEIADRLHGQVVWQQQRKGQWAAVLRFVPAGPIEAQVRRP